MNRINYLITGANGEVGHGIITALSQQKETNIIALDINPLDEILKQQVSVFLQGDVTDPKVLGIVKEHNFDVVYHLASLLSTKAENDPFLAHEVNVNSTLCLIKGLLDQGQKNCKTIKFIYPSSIAVYGVNKYRNKNDKLPIEEHEFLKPITMYGCNKLYIENIGNYFAHYYNNLICNSETNFLLDFRCVRFPGLISAQTIPTGGTSDFGPELLHHAASGREYSCFVRPDTVLPFMIMPDAINSLMMLEAAEQEKLKQHVYNVTSFSVSASDFFDVANQHFHGLKITWEIDEGRQKIVDSWPEIVSDHAARRDWGWAPMYDREKSFREYLIPALRERYK